MYTPPPATFDLKELLDSFSDEIDSFAELATLGLQLAANRERIIHALRIGAIEEARDAIRGICTEAPAVAGMVNFVMTSDPDSAINAIGMYDEKFAASLRNVRANFTRLQISWTESRGQRAEVRGQ